MTGRSPNRDYQNNPPLSSFLSLSLSLSCIMPGVWGLVVCIDPFSDTLGQQAVLMAGQSSTYCSGCQTSPTIRPGGNSQINSALKARDSCISLEGLSQSSVVRTTPWKALEMKETVFLLGAHTSMIIKLTHMWLPDNNTLRTTM